MAMLIVMMVVSMMLSNLPGMQAVHMDTNADNHPAPLVYVGPQGQILEHATVNNVIGKRVQGHTKSEVDAVKDEIEHLKRMAEAQDQQLLKASQANKVLVQAQRKTAGVITDMLSRTGKATIDALEQQKKLDDTRDKMVLRKATSALAASVNKQMQYISQKTTVVAKAFQNALQIHKSDTNGRLENETSNAREAINSLRKSLHDTERQLIGRVENLQRRDGDLSSRIEALEDQFEMHGKLHKSLRHPRNCVTTPWSAFSDCSALCGPGKKTRTRSVRIQPKHGGKACPLLIDVVTCNVKECDSVQTGPTGSMGSNSESGSSGASAGTGPITGASGAEGPMADAKTGSAGPIPRSSGTTGATGIGAKSGSSGASGASASTGASGTAGSLADAKTGMAGPIPRSSGTAREVMKMLPSDDKGSDGVDSEEEAEKIIGEMEDELK
jgi:hypothetical protein